MKGKETKFWSILSRSTFVARLTKSSGRLSPLPPPGFFFRRQSEGLSNTAKGASLVQRPFDEFISSRNSVGPMRMPKLGHT